MKLITKALMTKLQKNGRNAAETGESGDIVLKLFDPCGRFTFYVTDIAEDGDTLFGFTVSPLGPDCDEWGYASLREIASIRNKFGLGIERDKWFDGCTKAEINNGARP
jgi:hypothetical protein